MHPEAEPLFLVDRLYAAAVFLYNLFRDGQTESRARGVRCPEPAEGLEDV